MLVSVFRGSVARFFRESAGATLVEYGVALILAIVVGGTGLSLLGSQTSNNMAAAETAINFR